MSLSPDNWYPSSHATVISVPGATGKSLSVFILVQGSFSPVQDSADGNGSVIYCQSERPSSKESDSCQD